MDGLGVVGVGCGCASGVELEPVRRLAFPERLFVCGPQFVWDPAGERLPLVRTPRFVVAGAGSLAARVCGSAVSRSGRRFGVPTRERVVLR